MKADTVGLAAVFGSQVRYMVPLFQRPYVWNQADQWEPLWQDVQAVADRQLDDTPSNDEIPHFLGAVVFEQVMGPTTKVNKRSVVDGQQRLTTLQLLIAAARSVADEFDLDAAKSTFEELLLNKTFLVDDDYLYKVLPTNRDQAAFREAMADGLAVATGGHRIHHAYRYFRSSIHGWATSDGSADAVARRIDALTSALWDLVVIVTIDLEPADNAQVIFETLNARGTPLLAGDLIKNHVFQVATLQGADIASLYAERWAPLDSDWWREEVRRGRLRQPRIDVFLTYWLAMRTGEEVVSHDLFPAFKRYLAADQKRAEDVLVDLERYAKVYESFENEPESTVLGTFLYRLRVMDTTTVYPALLWMYGPDGIQGRADREAATLAIESWLVRRLITRMTAQNYNTVFLALINAVRTAAGESAATAQDVIDHLSGLRGDSQVWPTDEAVVHALRTTPVYTALVRVRTRMLLEALEEAASTGFTERVVLPHDLTIEHVMPQEWAAHWPIPEHVDPATAEARRDELKHTIGNLTLITNRLNPKLSNGPWVEKRAAFNEYSVLRISADIRQAEQWDESSIVERGNRLAQMAVAKWPRPATARVDTGASPVDERPAPPPASREAVVRLPDEDEFADVLAAADEVCVATELRRIVATSRELGLHPRPFRRSVMVSPPTDRRAYLFTVWPRPTAGGSFRLWPSVDAFVRFYPNLDPAIARAELGEEDGPRTLMPADVDHLLGSVGRLVEAGGAPADADAQGSGLPDRIEWLIAMRATTEGARIATDFARQALAIDGVKLRLQGGKGEPGYFQVRHRDFSQVVAYAHVKGYGLAIAYRLPADAETYGVAQVQDLTYAIGLSVRSDDDVRIAVKLLRDAVARSG